MASLTFGNDQLTPIVNVGGIEGQGGARYSGDGSKALLQFTIESIELGFGVSGWRPIHHNADAMVGFEAEALVLEVAQAAGKQTCAGE